MNLLIELLKMAVENYLTEVMNLDRTPKPYWDKQNRVTEAAKKVYMDIVKEIDDKLGSVS